MQLTELLFQRVQGLGQQGHVNLRPGYVTVLCGSAALCHAIIAALYAGPEDDRRLADGSGPTRIGLGVTPPAGAAAYRILRELGAERQLQKLEPSAAGAKKFQLLTKDGLEIESFLRLECALPTAELYAGVFVLGAAELPSVRGKPTAEGGGVDHKRIATLKAELEATRRYEEAQDELFRVAVKHRELEELVETLHKAQAAQRELDDKAVKGAYTPEQKADLVARAKRLRTDEGKRDEDLRNLNLQRMRLQGRVARTPQPFYKTTLFSGGLAAGLAIDALAFAFKRPAIALLGLAGFGASLVAALQWIAQEEDESLGAVRLAELKEREDGVRRAFLNEQAPLRQALQKAKFTDPDELLQLFDEMAELDAKRDAARARVAQLQEDPRLANAEAELAKLGEERQALETRVSAQGFARSVQQIEAELKEALGLVAAQPKKAALPDGEVPKLLFARAAEVLGTPVEPLASALEPRLSAYLTALTEKRVVAGRMDANGQLMLSTADARWGPYAGLPLPLRDLVYVALRLALLERVTLQKKAPVLVDDAFAPLEPKARVLTARMLKGISAQAQVVHRSGEPPPQGLADHLVQIP